MRRPAAAIIIIFLVLVANADTAGAYRLIEHRDWDLAVEGRVRFTVKNVRGSIEVIGWDRDEIEISARIRIRAASKNKAQKIYGKIEFEVCQEPGNISIKAHVPEYRKDSMSGEGNTAVWIDYSIRVPYTTDLDVRSVSGDIAVVQVGGTFRVVSERGSIDMLSRGGEGVLKTGSGDIGCELAFLPAGGKLRLKTGNGDLSLGIPAETSAMLSAKTRVGRVRVGLDMTDIDKQKRKILEGVLGGGDGKILLESANGDVTIKEL
ncbi:MAG: DUF4097 family beta strand repeat protein [Candidatus Krumholzibacteria bacterium]|nr:DUF4097 family beta strand repeat protein [Candidatus Krumholzibacteria bacterium]